MWRSAIITPSGTVKVPRGPRRVTPGVPLYPARNAPALDADVAAVGLRQLDLSGTALRAKDADMLQFALGADDVQTFLAGKLAGLAQRLFGGELVAIAEQLVHIIAGKVDVPAPRCLPAPDGCAFAALPARPA